MENPSSIAEFFNNRSIFITGASGFMGKVLLEKLLRSCSGVKNIYVLLRHKKGLNTRQRLEEILNSKIFDRIREENEKSLNKVIPIQGDITLEGLGISENEINTLINDVSIVFHSAATVKFEEPLKNSVDFNVLGTRRVINFCHKLTKIVALVHVSTAYANCNRNEIDERVYPPPIEAKNIINTINWMPEDVIDDLTPKLLGKRPNTYTYTKALAENLLMDEGGSLPIAIVRPSIVTASWKEPFCGWVDSLNGATGLVIAVGKGFLRSMLVKPGAVADIIPVDAVINLMIVVAWFTAKKQQNSVMIYHCTSGSLNPITWGSILNIGLTKLKRYPSSQVFRYPNLNLHASNFINKITKFIQHQVVAFFFDTFCALTGRKKIMLNLYAKINKVVNSLEWFTTHEFSFKCKNYLMLSEQLHGSDKENFYFDIRSLNWDSYWEDYIIGIRKFLLKEDETSLPIARKNLQRLFYINKCLEILALIGIVKFILYQSDTARRLWTLFLILQKHYAVYLVKKFGLTFFVLQKKVIKVEKNNKQHKIYLGTWLTRAANKSAT